ncbi:MAG: hypothetical protein EZS28_032241 [Streblomastix strix]|uniref:Uncharacterized protein n=1 Tax=Streblomastix strix TaxID=222440 RepID=A0A5J4UQE9_9EUKA|nr:MAG: hypothetical protein EZS28_032241 [Streblomastix strix]
MLGLMNTTMINMTLEDNFVIGHGQSDVIFVVRADPILPYYSQNKPIRSVAKLFLQQPVTSVTSATGQVRFYKKCVGGEWEVADLRLIDSL